MTILSRTAVFTTVGALALSSGLAFAQSDPLRIAYAAVGSFQPFFIAQEKGWFEEAGLTVELVPGGNPQENMARLMSGEVHAAGSGLTPAIAAVAGGAPIQIISGNQTMGEDPTTGLIVRADSSYQKVSDMAGKTIGVQGLQGTGALMVSRALVAEGSEPGAVSLTHMPPETHIDNLRNGNVDGVVSFALFYELAARSDEFRVLEDAYDVVKGAPGIVYVSSTRAIAERGEDLARLVEVMDRASQYANENPDEVRAVDAAQTRLPADYLESRVITPAGVTINTEKLLSVAEDMQAFGWTPRVPTEDELLWEGAPRN